MNTVSATRILRKERFLRVLTVKEVFSWRHELCMHRWKSRYIPNKEIHLGGYSVMAMMGLTSSLKSILSIYVTFGRLINIHEPIVFSPLELR